MNDDVTARGKLRRIALDRQGLLKINSFGRGKRAALRAIEHLGYVQIDTISVVERAHHHVLWSRVSNYRPEILDQLVRERKIFEYWFHAASWLPMRDYRFALPRMSTINGERSWFENCDKKLIRHILERVREEGPLRARDFEDTRSGKKEWWDWKPAKRALEQLFMQGELMVTERQGFQKVYDLAERVLPEGIDTNEPSSREYASFLIDTSLRAHGFATRKSFTYLRRGQVLRDAVSAELAERVDSRKLASMTLNDGATAFIDPELLEDRAPRSRALVRLLSPFDNAIIQRERGTAIFNFDYQIECYVPEEKRNFGYFSLPILYRDQLVGRVDCKAHRQSKRFELKSLHIERDVDDEFTGAFCEALRSFVVFNDCDEIAIGETHPECWQSVLESAC